MRDNLRIYVDALFQDVPVTQKAVELKEEILQNVIDKYDDLILSGKSEEAAYNIAIAGIGDIGALISDLGIGSPYQAPEPLYSREELERGQKRSAIIVAVSVVMYILSLVPAILFDELLDSDLGIIITFVIVAAATGLLIYNSMMKKPYKKAEDTVVEEFKQWNASTKADKQVFKSLSAALWAIITVVYFIVSFTTFAWHITWVIFIIGVAIEAIMKAIFDLKRSR